MKLIEEDKTLTKKIKHEGEIRIDCITQFQWTFFTAS